MSQILTRAAFENAIRVNGAVGGSTNAVLHLLAIAGRVGVPLTLRGLGRARPRRADDRRPDAVGPVPDGGLLLRRRAARRDPRARRERAAQSRRDDGQRPDDLGELRGRAELECRSDPADRPAAGARTAASRCCAAIWRRTGAVLKPSAASPHLMRHRGRAVVFESIEHYNDAHRRSGARRRRRLRAGAEGLRSEGLSRAWRRSATWACRRRCCSTGVTDMVRISDARMSGTAYGTAVLHVSPEAAAGGPLALVRDGDMIELDVEARRLHLDVSDDGAGRAAARHGASRSRSCRPAATRSCTSSTCSRRIRAPIWIFSSAAAGTRSRASRTDQLSLPASAAS